MLDAAIALNRFGLGARPTDVLPSEPKSWLVRQFNSFQPRPEMFAQLPSRSDVIGQLADYSAETRMIRAAKRRMQQASLSTDASNAAPEELARKQMLGRAFRADYLQMNSARLSSALSTNSPFAERLVHFWGNHFAVSIDKPALTGLAGLLEFDAIRPHVFGRFSDLLLAVEQHPAMLVYLDQVQSGGPNSEAAQMDPRPHRRPGLNENLAREILELHTLGVRTGYTQEDVTEFARALTGWTVSGYTRGPLSALIGGSGQGEFQFAQALHEPGLRTIMGKRYAEPGEQQARSILLDLANAPATAKHISTKLARHFAGDDPPAPMIDRLTHAYLASGGDLPTVYRAIIDSPETWAEQPLKFKTPWEWSVSALRALGETELNPSLAAGMLRELGQPTWDPRSPAGWDDIAASWAAPEALMRRVEIAQRLADHAGSSLDARALAEKVLPGGLSQATRSAIARAESPQEGLALLLVSPQFMRR